MKTFTLMFVLSAALIGLTDHCLGQSIEPTPDRSANAHRPSWHPARTAASARMPSAAEFTNALVSGTPSGPELFTSFEDVVFIPDCNCWGFDIRWIDAARSATPDKSKALSGEWSAFFSEGFFSNSFLRSTQINIPQGTSTAVVSAWAWTGNTAGSFTVKLTAGTASENSKWNFKNDDMGHWVLRRSTIVVPGGATTFKMEVDLDSRGVIDANRQWLDNLTIEFLSATPPAISEVLVADIGGNISAFDTAHGKQNWTTHTGGLIQRAPSIANAIAYTTSLSPDQLTAVDARSGTLIWQKHLGSSSAGGCVVAGKSVLLCGSDGILRAFDTARGDQQWQVDAFGFGSNTHDVNGITLDATSVYLTSDAGAAAVNVADKTVMWRSAVRSKMPYPGVVGAGLFFAGSTDSNFYAINSSGATAWKVKTGGPVQCNPQYINGGVIFGSDDGNLYVAESRTGNLLSTLNVPNAAYVRSFLYEQGFLFVTSNAVSGALYGYSLGFSQTGAWQWTKKWSQPIQNGAQADPTVCHDAVIITVSDKTVRAFNVVSGAPKWTSPTAASAFAGPLAAVPPPSVDTSLRFDQVCWLTTHNSYSNSQDGWWYAQQNSNILTQLDSGVRGLMLDVWACPAGSNTLVYAHEGCDVSAWLLPFSKWVKFSDSLADINAWLNRNPEEIVTLILEQRADNKAQVTNAINSSGIANSLFYSDRVNTGSTGATWDVRSQGWPPLAWMIANDRRAVIFSDQHWPNRFNDGLPYVWDAAVENEYGNDSRNGKCQARASSQPIGAPGSPSLFIQNYNTTISLDLPVDDEGLIWTSDYLNNYYSIMSLVDGCVGLNGQLPNFLAVDWYDRGFNGGPTRAVAEINNRWAQSR